MQKMKLFALLTLTFECTLFQIISSQTHEYGDEFTNWNGADWWGDTLHCNDFMPCTVNCWGDFSCSGVTINGPINATLTIHCDSTFGGEGQEGVGSCRHMNVYADNSTTLRINVHNEDWGFFANHIYTPNTNNPLLTNTFITCGLIEDHNPSTPKTFSCGQLNNIYGLNGWQTVEWSYAGAASWSLNQTDPSNPNIMHCGNDYVDSCSGFVVDGFYYRCAQTSSACDYDRSSEPQSHTSSPTTAQPTANPIAPTSSPTNNPTNPGDLASVYNSNVTLSPDTTYQVVSDIQINDDVFFNIPGGVEIVFMGAYNIYVYGTLTIGCDTIDTLDNHDIGIISESQAAFLYTDSNSRQNGRGVIHIHHSASFCNTRFANLSSIYYWMYSESPSSLFVDNCEFLDMGDALHWANSVCHNQLQHITDNKFMNCAVGILEPMCVNIENNVFKSVYNAIQCAKDATITNNTFGSADDTGFLGVSTCTVSSNITQNTFINLQEAIRAWTPTTIFYNEFMDNTYGIYIRDKVKQQINYNNFINNSYSIYVTDCSRNTIRWDMCDQPNSGYNYYGVSSTNQSIISSQIHDLCDGGEGYGLVTWWPWYTEPIDFNSLPTTLQEHTFEIIECVAADAHPAITGNKLAPIYPYDTTLTSSNSPYYIVSLVRTATDATIYVESGVQLIFADNYDIQISGALIMGCDAIDTAN
eukprot:1011716_1